MENPHICVHEGELGKIEADIENLVRWQQAQNGSMHRTEKKVDAINDKFSDLYKERYKTYVGFGISILLLLANFGLTLLIKKG